jgi:hypothetical protein
MIYLSLGMAMVIFLSGNSSLSRPLEKKNLMSPCPQEENFHVSVPSPRKLTGDFCFSHPVPSRDFILAGIRPY